MEKELYEEKFSNVTLRLNSHEQRITSAEEKLVETDKALAVSIKGINTSLETLAGLPRVITNVNENMAKMGSTMELMQWELKRNTKAIANLEEDTNLKFKEIQGNVEKIDGESKLNLRVWLTQNFAKIIVSGSVLGALIKYLTN